MPKLSLQMPIEIGKITITELTFREYTTAGDYLAFDKPGGVAQRISLIARLTGNDEAIIERMSGRDYVKAEAIADDLLKQDDLLPEEAEKKP
jgi:hypothetical protein